MAKRNQINQGDIIFAESIKTPALVVSGESFNADFMIVCPIVKEAAKHPLHIEINTVKADGIVLCEHPEYLELNECGYEWLGKLDNAAMDDISKALQGIFKSSRSANLSKEEIVSDILDNNRLIYFFQPIVDAGSGEIFAYEALMRSDTEEPVSPLDILECAERLGRLSDVEKATFSNVISYIEDHEELFAGKKIFINSIPGVQFPKEYEAAIFDKIKQFKDKIVVELIEQAEASDDELAALKQKFMQLGVETAVDDYGTGYSNVYNLLRYMPDYVKIDRMLLNKIHLSAQKQHFVKEIIEFAHNNNITALAEGIETPDELKMVTSLGVDLIQGYYTARPKAAVIQCIENEIRNEIVQYSQFVVKENMRQVYNAGNEQRLSLIQLAASHYSKIRFASGDVKYRDVLIEGRKGFFANIEIEIDDSYTGRIELKDADFSMHNEQPAIRLGENCDVTLALTGDNILEQGGILVPESSKLTLLGAGNLSIKKIALEGYGIGNDKDSRHGELYFEQDGHIDIKGNTIHAVGIGSGYGGKIFINRGTYAIQLSGIEAVGIGSLHENTGIMIDYCAISIDTKNSISVGIGSLDGNADITISHVSINGIFNANRCVCIGTLDGGSLKLDFTQGTADLNAHSDDLCAVGSINGSADISAGNFSLKILAEGQNALALGNLSRTANILTQNGEFRTYVKNKTDYDIGADVFELTNIHGEFILNGKAVERGLVEE